MLSDQTPEVGRLNVHSHVYKQRQKSVAREHHAGQQQIVQASGHLTLL